MLRHLCTLFVLSLLVLFSSCLKTYDNVEIEEWEPEVAVPIFNASLTIQDLLDNFETGGYVNVDQDQFISVVYEGEAGTIYGEDLLDLDDFTLPVLDTAIAIPYGNLPFQYDLNKVDFKSGKFSISFDANFTEDLDVKIMLSNLLKNGVPFEMDMPVDYTGSSPVEMSNNIDLDGYTLSFADDQFEVRYVATRSSNGERVRLDNMMLNFEEMKYSHAEGYFGQQELSMPAEAIIIDLFEDAPSSNVYFEDPRIDVILENSYGIPVVVTAEVLKAETHNNGTMPITSDFDNGIAINFPSISEAGTTENTTISLTNSTSNIADVISNNPYQIDYLFSAQFNPDDNSSIRGFVKDSSFFKVKLDIELPLWVRVGGTFVNESTSDFDNEVLENVKEGEFILYTENGLPVDAGLQLYFENDNGQVFDSLFQNSETFIDAATVNADGRVNNMTSNTTTVTLQQGMITNIKEATKIRVKGTVGTDALNTGTSVKFYADYGLNFNLGFKATLKDIN